MLIYKSDQIFRAKDVRELLVISNEEVTRLKVVDSVKKISSISSNISIPLEWSIINKNRKTKSEKVVKLQNIYASNTETSYLFV